MENYCYRPVTAGKRRGHYSKLSGDKKREIQRLGVSDKMTTQKNIGVALIGPTGIGKTELSLEMGERFAGEIVSVDSMQVHRFMDVGTAKAGLEERARVVHHLLDIVFPDEDYNAARFVADASRAMEEIQARDHLPLLVGGTGLYLKGLLKGFFEIRENPELRQKLRSRAEEEGLQPLYEELLRCDSQSAARIHPQDSYRIIRALEVVQTTGIPWSEHIARQDQTVPGQNILKLGLNCAREDLYARLDMRVEMMVEQGLLREVRNLLALGYDEHLKSMQSIGYRHMTNYLKGVWGWEESLLMLRRDTRRYAKRQLTWFRRDSEIEWFHPGQKREIFARVAQFLTAQQKQEIPLR
jgi:tRNA dimethylallyltransferase